MRTVLRTLDEIGVFFQSFNWSLFCFDTETTDLRYDRLQIIGLSLFDGSLHGYIPIDDNNRIIVMSYLQDKFNSTKGKGSFIIGHNLVFDLKVLTKYNVLIRNAELFDTLIAAHLLDEYQSKSLKELSKKYLGVETVSWEDAKKQGYYSEKFYDYALNDSEWTWKIAQMMKKELEAQGLVKLFKQLEMPFQYALLQMATSGVLIDIKLVDKITAKIRKEAVDLEIDLLEYLKEPYELQTNLFSKSFSVVSNIDFNSPKQLADILFERLKLPVVEYTPSGTPATGKKTIEKHRNHEFIQMLMKFKIAQKLLTAFFEPLPDFIQADGRVYPEFKDHGTKTGRLSCEHPNLQQLPKSKEEFPIETRACFTVPEGYEMITCDYSGQEVAVMAEISKDPTLVDALNKGQDLHLKIANQFYNLGIPDEYLYSTSENYEKIKKKYKKERDRAKTITFGLAYGKGAYGFSKDFGITEEEAQQIVDKYFASMPEVKSAIDKAKQDILKQGYVTNLVGRKRRFQMEFGKYPNKVFRQAFNFQIQGSSADMIRAASIATLNLSRKHPEWDLKIIGSVHDENIYEVKKEYATLAAQEIKKAFSAVAQKFIVPVCAEIGRGMNYANAK